VIFEQLFDDNFDDNLLFSLVLLVKTI